MKTFIISLIVLAILMVGINIYSFYLEDTMNDIQESIDSISLLAYEKEWERCNNKVESLFGIWNKTEPVLAMFNDHEDVDNIKLSLTELKESVLHENYEHTFKAIEETKILLERLSKNENLWIENILGLAHFGIQCHNML